MVSFIFIAESHQNDLKFFVLECWHRSLMGISRIQYQYILYLQFSISDLITRFCILLPIILGVQFSLLTEEKEHLLHMCPCSCILKGKLKYYLTGFTLTKTWIPQRQLRCLKRLHTHMEFYLILRNGVNTTCLGLRY